MCIHTILVLAAPPCPDFSRIHEGPGKEGESGKLFGLFCDLLSSLEDLLKGRSMALLVENVIMACSGDINYFSQRLRCEPIIVDAADWGVVHRPRLWWTRVDWTRCTEFKWTRQGRLYRLHAPVQPQGSHLSAAWVRAQQRDRGRHEAVAVLHYTIPNGSRPSSPEVHTV